MNNMALLEESPSPYISPQAQKILDEIFTEIDDDDVVQINNNQSLIDKVKKRIFPDDDENKGAIFTITGENSLAEIDIASMDIAFEDGTVISAEYSNNDDLTVKTDNNQNNKKENPEIQVISTDDTIQENNSLNNNCNDKITIKKLTRKRSRNADNWKANIRKRKREHGEEYIDIKGKSHCKRGIKYGCKRNNCKFQCFKNINEDKRQEIHNSFWKMNDCKKANFYNKYVLRRTKARVRTKSESSRKQFSYEYYFEVDSFRFRVCKDFFLGTLDISSQRIYYFFKTMKNSKTGLPRTPLKGKNQKKVISNEAKDIIRNHIKAFPVVESHYCRASSKRTYLESNLNLTKMYSLYVESVEKPQKMHVYRHIFNYEFNIAFHKPKKDVCDKCAEFKLNASPTIDQQLAYNAHITRKVTCKKERDKDRKNEEKLTAVVTFDLENVFSLPKTNISSHFYKQKLTCYNLTAHCSANKTIYCSIWHEGIAGRGGIEIANGLVRILRKVVEDNPYLTKIILWSDSCVPQNKNSIMSLALQDFLLSPHSGKLQKIEQKYSEPGHGNVQEVDSAHSVIERHVREININSPLSLVRTLKKLPEGKIKFSILQMRVTDYLNYEAKASNMKYSLVPYTKVKHIVYDKENIFKIKYRKDFGDDLESVFLLDNTGVELRGGLKEKPKFPKIMKLNPKFEVSESKKQALFSMLSTMEIEDREFYTQTILKDFESARKEVSEKSTEKAEEAAGSTSTKAKAKKPTKKGGQQCKKKNSQKPKGVRKKGRRNKKPS